MIEAYSEARAQLRAGLIRGVCKFVFDYPHSVDKELLALALQEIEAEEIEIAARALRRDTGESTDVIIARQVGNHYQAVYFPRGTAVVQPLTQTPKAATVQSPPRVSIMAEPAKPAQPTSRSVSVMPVVQTGIVTCACKRQFRPAFPGQSRCVPCGNKYSASDTVETSVA